MSTSSKYRPIRITRPVLALLYATAAAISTAPARAGDTSAEQQLSRWSTQAGTTGDAEQGRAFFASRHGGQWSCSSCHGSPPVKTGQHASTGKEIAPLAPAFNPRAFTDSARVDKWFRRNCNDVAKRECSATEKAHVLAYLIGLKP